MVWSPPIVNGHDLAAGDLVNAGLDVVEAGLDHAMWAVGVAVVDHFHVVEDLQPELR